MYSALIDKEAFYSSFFAHEPNLSYQDLEPVYECFMKTLSSPQQPSIISLEQHRWSVVRSHVSNGKLQATLVGGLLGSGLRKQVFCATQCAFSFRNKAWEISSAVFAKSLPDAGSKYLSLRNLSLHDTLAHLIPHYVSLYPFWSEQSPQDQAVCYLQNFYPLSLASFYDCDPQTLIQLAKATTTAFSFLHDQGYVHGDATLENIFIEHSLEEELYHARLNDFDLTQNLLTPLCGYYSFPPEELSGDQVEIVGRLTATPLGDILQTTLNFYRLFMGSEASTHLKDTDIFSHSLEESLVPINTAIRSNLNLLESLSKEEELRSILLKMHSYSICRKVIKAAKRLQELAMHDAEFFSLLAPSKRSPRQVELLLDRIYSILPSMQELEAVYTHLATAPILLPKKTLLRHLDLQYL